MFPWKRSKHKRCSANWQKDSSVANFLLPHCLRISQWKFVRKYQTPSVAGDENVSSDVDILRRCIFCCCCAAPVHENPLFVVVAYDVDFPKRRLLCGFLWRIIYIEENWLNTCLSMEVSNTGFKFLVQSIFSLYSYKFSEIWIMAFWFNPWISLKFNLGDRKTFCYFRREWKLSFIQ